MTLGRRLLLLAAISFFYVVSAQPQRSAGISSSLNRIRSGVVVEEGAICSNKVSAFFVSDNVQLKSTNVLFYGDVTEEQCTAMCADNKDLKGRAILCASFNYDHLTFSCMIFREKSIPDGIATIKPSPGARFFEKFCLPSSAPIDCGESHFFRAEQSVLVGFAKNVTIVRTLEECVAVCLSEVIPCKSAMFFYEEGECITNTESAESMPEVFAKEEVDKVVYFENACLKPNAYKNPKNEKLASGGRQAVQKQTHQERQNSALKAPKATPQPVASETAQTRVHVTLKPHAHSRTTVSLTKAHASKIVETVDPLPLPGYSAWSEWSICDRPDGRRVRRRECLIELCTETLLQVQWCKDINPDELTTTTKEPASTTTTAAPSTLPPTTSTAPLHQQAWGPWEGRCQKFSNGQFCNNGVMIGFETRHCGGNPFLCQGPFFRYCTLPC